MSERDDRGGNLALECEQRFSRRVVLARALALGAGLLPLLAACQGSVVPTPGPTLRPTEPPVSTAQAPAVLAEPIVAPAQTAPGRSRPFAGQTVAIQIWSGPFAQVIRDTVQPDFEAEHGVSLLIRDGMPADQMARLRAERASPRHIMMGLDDLSASMARREDLVAPLDPNAIPNLADVHPEYVLEDGFAVAQGVNWITVWYNAEKIKTPPSTYEAFWDPHYKGRVAVPAMGITTGLQWLVVSAAVGSGKPLVEAQLDMEPGFEKWKQLKPNLHSTFDSFSASARLLAQGEVWMSFGHSRQADYFVLKGAPVMRAPVREGAFLGSNAMVLVKNLTFEPLGRDLINRILAPGPQAELARLTHTGPASMKALVSSKLAALVPVGSDEARRMVRLNWDYLNRHRVAWADRWQQEIGA